ncbi:hypothetical protein HY745_06085 [Candidatus Desantisbacteria bacterium]|nr:hypothetical protein [Candidatus Desantisbacteria bacterium]
MDEKKIVHILTVGISLLTNGGETESRKPGNDKGEQRSIKNLNSKSGEIRNNIKSNSLSENDLKSEVCSFLTDFNKSIDPIYEINLRKNKQTVNTPQDRLPQEISYLFKRIEEKKSRNKQKENYSH